MIDALRAWWLGMPERRRLAVDAVSRLVVAPTVVAIARIHVDSTGRALYPWEQWLAYGFAGWLLVTGCIRLWRAWHRPRRGDSGRA